jgi:hypothetical protein
MMMNARTYPTVLLVLMGSMDCLTTVIGIMYFGAVELNPFLSGIISNNIAAFVILKLTTTVFVSLIFVQTEKILNKTTNKTTNSFKWTHRLLKVAYTGVIAFLIIVVANNLLVLVTTH